MHDRKHRTGSNLTGIWLWHVFRYLLTFTNHFCLTFQKFESISIQYDQLLLLTCFANLGFLFSLYVRQNCRGYFIPLGWFTVIMPLTQYIVEDEHFITRALVISRIWKGWSDNDRFLFRFGFSMLLIQKWMSKISSAHHTNNIQLYTSNKAWLNIAIRVFDISRWMPIIWFGWF